MFPGLINGCTVDWFLPWPQAALEEVAQSEIGKFEIDVKPEVKAQLIRHMAQTHQVRVRVRVRVRVSPNPNPSPNPHPHPTPTPTPNPNPKPTQGMAFALGEVSRERLQKHLHKLVPTLYRYTFDPNP